MFTTQTIISGNPPIYLKLYRCGLPVQADDTATGPWLKPVTVETGAVINAPLFINKKRRRYSRGAPRTGEYIERSSLICINFFIINIIIRKMDLNHLKSSLKSLIQAQYLKLKIEEEARGFTVILNPKSEFIANTAPVKHSTTSATDYSWELMRPK